MTSVYNIFDFPESDDNVNKSLKTKTNSNNNSNSRRRKSLNSLMITTESPIKRLNKKSMNTSKLTEKINPKTTIVNDVSNKLSSKNKSPTKQQQFNKPFLSKAPKTTTTMSTTKCVSSPLSIFPYYQEEKIDTVNVVSTTTTSQSLSPSSPGSRKQNLVAKISTSTTTTGLKLHNHYSDNNSILDLNLKCDLDLSLPPSSSLGSSNVVISGLKTYGQGRTILGRSNDMMLMDFYDPPPKSKFSKEAKTSHVLREVGENSRFTDEMNYILDGLRSSQPLNVRRTSGMELAQKLLNKEFLLKIRAHNYIPKIYSNLIAHKDTDKHNSEFLLLEHGLLEMIINSIDVSYDPFIDNNNRSLEKYEKKLVNDLRDIIFQSNIFTDKSQISLKAIALRTLSSITSSRTRNESLIKRKLRVSGGLSFVINALKLEFELVSVLLINIKKNKPSTSKIKLNFRQIIHCLKILENATLFCTENQMHIVEENKEFLKMLLEFLLYCHVEAFNINSQVLSSAMECLLGSLRVLINLTNDNQSCCQYIGGFDGISILMRLAIINSEKLVDNFDVLLLSIGLLINLVEMDPNNQNVFSKVEQNPQCSGSYKCLRTCKCFSRESALTCLVNLYNYQIHKGEEETDSNIAAAYMAILLDRSFGSLINILQQFVHFNQLVNEEASTNNNNGGGGGVRSTGDSFLEIVELFKSLELQKTLSSI
ncbi:16209_t:CDS:10 [Entrophospora sp. SA101]|nr:16209_t:CDS:10 [Entrophospora sp. SA101]